MPAARSIALGCWVAVGNRDEPESVAGASHFCEHLLFKGTASRSAREIAELVDATGGDMNAYTTKEYTAFYLRVPASDFPLALDILCDVISSPALRENDVESERDVILEELHLQLDEPDDLVHTELSAALFPGHALGWEILGTADTIGSMSADAIRSFHAEWYRPANLVFAAAGPIEHDAFVAAIAAAFPSSDGGQAPARVAPITPPVLHRVVPRKVESVHVALGWRAFGHHDPDRHALAVLNQILGAGMSSRLFQEIREERGLAYSVFSGINAYRDAGYLTVYAGCANEAVGEVIDLVVEEMKMIKQAPVPDSELRRAKDHLKGSVMLGLENTSSRMSHLARQEIYFDRQFSLVETLQGIESVTPEDVQRVAADLFSNGSLAATVLGQVNGLQLPRERLDLN